MVMSSKLVYVEWGSDGKVHRLIHEIPYDDTHQNIADRIVNKLTRPHRLDQWDVEWCKRDECYYVNESGGWSGRVYLNQMAGEHRCSFWAADHIEFCRATLRHEELTPAEISELGYDRVQLDKPPEDLAQTCEEEMCYWCSICEDMFPLNGNCAHQHWCDRCGTLITPDDAPCGEECRSDED
jgi:hypothetical protein